MAAIISFNSLGGGADLAIHLNEDYEHDEDYQNGEPNVVWRVLVVAYEVVKEVAEKAVFRCQLLLSPAESLPWIEALKFAESCNRVNSKPLNIEDRRELARAVEVCVRAELASTSKKARACTRCHHSLFHLRCITCTSSSHGLTSIPPLGRPVPLPMATPTPIHPTTATIDALNSAAQCAAAMVARKQTPRTLQRAVEVAVAVVDSSRLGGAGLAPARSDASLSTLPYYPPGARAPPSTPATPYDQIRGPRALTPHTEEPSHATTLSTATRSTHPSPPSVAPPPAGASPSRCSSCSSLSTDIDLNTLITDDSETDDDTPTPSSSSAAASSRRHRRRSTSSASSSSSARTPPRSSKPPPPPTTATPTPPPFVPPVVPTLNLTSATGRAPPPDHLQGPLTPAQSATPPHAPPQDPTAAAAFDRHGSAHSTASVTPQDPTTPRSPKGTHPKKPHLDPVHELTEPTSPTFATSSSRHPTTTTDDASYGSASASPTSIGSAVTVSPFDPPAATPPSAAATTPSAAAAPTPSRSFHLHVPTTSTTSVHIQVHRHDPTAPHAASSTASTSSGPSTPNPPAAPPLNSHALDFDDAHNILSSYFGEVFRTAASRSAAGSTFDSRPPSSTMHTAYDTHPTPTPPGSALETPSPHKSRLSRPAPVPTAPARDPYTTPAPAPPSAHRLPPDLPNAPTAPTGYITPRFETPRYEVVKINPYARISGGSGAAEALEQLQAAQHAAAAAAALPERLRHPSSAAAPSLPLHGEGLDLLPSACAAYSAARDLNSAHPHPPTTTAPPTAAAPPVQRRHSAPVPVAAAPPAGSAPTAAAALAPTPPAAAALLAATGGRTPVTPLRQVAEAWADAPMLEGMGSSPVNNARTPKLLRHASQPVMAEIQEEPAASSAADRTPLRTVTRQRASPSYHSFGIQLGQGSFGTVQKGLWRGRMVAIKTICVQGADVRGQEHAMREAAITYSLDHPNIIKTYSWDVQVADAASPRPMGAAGATPGAPPGAPPTPAILTPRTPRTPRTAAGPPSAAPSDWVVSMVVELCDADLVQALRASCFHTPDRRPILPSILQMALDIARGMEHLHSRRIIHGDLKSTNVLLKHHRSAASGFIAKVADLGMAYKLPRGSTEILGVHSGTRGYIAPEVQHEGTISQASDVYSFGVVLWELYHAKPAVASRMFPAFQRGCPAQLEDLVRSCLSRAPAGRPTFGGVMLQLCTMIESMSRPSRQQRQAAAHRAA